MGRRYRRPFSDWSAREAVWLFMLIADAPDRVDDADQLLADCRATMLSRECPATLYSPEWDWANPPKRETAS